MKLIVGLGNPGEKYEKTRHNLGFMVVDHFLKNLESAKQTAWTDDKKLKSDIFQTDWESKMFGREKIILAKPKTYMNNSGMAVSLISSFYKIPPIDIWIINDDLDLPVGFMKIRFGGASAGHHGVESIIDSLGTDKFWRFRLGIGESHHHDEMAKHNQKSAEEFVLDKFSGSESGTVKHLVKHGANAIEDALEKGIEFAQNRYNTK